MIRPILAYGNPILKKKTNDIGNDDLIEIKDLVKDLWDTMYNAKGVGIAAPQIGISKSIFVIDFSYFKDEDSFNESELTNQKQVFINPKIITESGQDFTYPEGCLSIPNITENVVRKSNLKMSYLDEDLNPQIIICSGIIARVIQHEYDHLQGILFTDKLAYKTRKILKNELNNINNGNTEVKYEMSFFEKKN